jgi:hypothetical protein
MRLEILFASALTAAAIASGAQAQTTTCRHNVFDRVRCRPAPAQPAIPRAEPAAPEPQAQPTPAAPSVGEPPAALAPRSVEPAPTPLPPAAVAPAPQVQAAAPEPESAPPAAAPPPSGSAPAAHAQETPLSPAPSPPPLAPAIDPRTAPPYACNFAQGLTLGPAVCEARKVADARRRVSELVAAHRCDEAARAATETGDAGFAARVREFCRPVGR